jgi:hypothetical protein
MTTPVMMTTRATTTMMTTSEQTKDFENIELNPAAMVLYSFKLFLHKLFCIRSRQCGIEIVVDFGKILIIKCLD